MLSPDPFTPAHGLLELYRRKTVSPVEVLQAALDRLATKNVSLNAVYFVDEERARAAAKASEARWMRGEPRGLLDGIPTTVKDALPLAGTPSFRGCAAHDAAASIQTFDAPCVARLKENGAVLFAKTVMCDLGIFASGRSSMHGPVRNPWNPALTPGGSSAGAAATVAAGISPLVVGTDIVGSIRNPASFCGLVGFKPSHGKVPYYFPNSPALVAGPIARDLPDAMLLHNVITQPDERDFTALPYDGVDYVAALSTPLASATLGLLGDIGFGVPPDQEVLALVESAARTLAGQGHRLTPVRTTFAAHDGKDAEDFYRARIQAELAQHPDALQRKTPILYRWGHEGSDSKGVDLYRSYAGLLRLAERAHRLLDGIDYLLLPAAPTPPHAAELAGHDETRFFDSWCNTFPFNLSQNPAISINCGLTKSGLPVGLQIVGRRFDDLGVVRLAHQFELARGPISWPA